MNKLTLDACPLCGKTQLIRLMTCTDYYATGESFDVFCCKECSFRFTQSFPYEAEIGKYYETPDYISHSDTKKGLINSLYHGVRKYMLNRKAALVIRHSSKTTGRILDIGTGTGYFCNTMRKKGWQTEGIEKSMEARAFAQKRFGMKIKDETALYGFPANSFDAITLWHVMEHLQHLHEVWQYLYKLLDKEGVLVVAVPNCNSFDAEKYKEMWAAYDVPRHLWHFTPETIKKCGEQHGFYLVKQYPMPFDAFYVSMLSEKYKKKASLFLTAGSYRRFLPPVLTAGSYRRFLPPVLTGLYAGSIAWLKALAKPGKSSSIIYVFKKQE